MESSLNLERKNIILMVFLGLLLFSLFVFNLSERNNDNKNENSKSISDEYSVKIVSDYLKSSDNKTRQECLSYVVNKQEEYFEIEVREKHNKNCSGDENTSPLIGIFRVNQSSGALTQYDVKNDRYVQKK